MILGSHPSLSDSRNKASWYIPTQPPPERPLWLWGAAWLSCNCQQAWGMCESTCARLPLWGTVHRKPSKTAPLAQITFLLPSSCPL